jgi:hypothetical protein
MTDTVNSQVTDAVTQTGVSVLGGASAQSMGMVYQSMAHAISLLMQNAVSAQGGMQQINAAVVASACKQILTASTQAYEQRNNLALALTLSGNGKDQGKNGKENGKGNDGENEPERVQSPEEQAQQQLNDAHQKAQKCLQEAAKAAREAGESDSDALNAAEDILQQEPPDQDKIKQVFLLARQSTRASQNASSALVKAQSFASKALEESDPKMATQYAIEAEQAQEEAKDAAAEAKDAATKALEIATKTEEPSQENNQDSGSV